MPIYAATQQHAEFAGSFKGRYAPARTIPPLAGLLAEFHTSINIAGMRYFGGNIDRFMVFCLLLRTSLSHPDRNGAISVHSAAMSLGRPFETIRRHVCALLDRNVCERTPNGVRLSRPYWEAPANWRQMRHAHDCFVRLVADGVAIGAIPATSATELSGRTLSLDDGVRAAADLLLALADANRRWCAEAIDLAIFSAVLHGNRQAFEADRAMPGGPASLLPRHAVRVAQMARALSVPNTTVRRRIAPFCGNGGLYIRTSKGLLVAVDRFRTDDAGNCGDAKHGSIRLIIQRAVAAGLSLRDPARSYCERRPPTPRVD
jgi:hypothetical protein